MVRKDVIALINHHAGIFVSQVKIQSAAGLQDLLTHAEHDFISILNAVFKLDLQNANQIRKNHPATDLVDREKGIAFQITTSTTTEKVADTLKTFIAEGLHERFTKLYIYIHVEKRKNYNTAKIRNIVKGKVEFEVIDYRDIIRQISFITSDDILGQIAGYYKQLNTSLLTHLNASKTHLPSPYTSDILRELSDLIGGRNATTIPEVSELSKNLTDLEVEARNMEYELKRIKEAMTTSKDESISFLMADIYQKVTLEYRNVLQAIELKNKALKELKENIRRQKEFLDQIDYKQASERMIEARRLFEDGEYARVNMLLNYEGRQQFIIQKLQEKQQLSSDLESLANEETLLAFNLLRGKDWLSRIQEIKLHFEQSIALGGYGANSQEYALFLEEIGEKDHARAILLKTLPVVPENSHAIRAFILTRLGKLMEEIDIEGSIQYYLEAISIYETLYDEDHDEYEFELASTLLTYGTLKLNQSSLDESRRAFEEALILVSNRNKEASPNLQKLTYTILIALISLHQQLDNSEDMSSYLRMALYMGAGIALWNKNDTVALLEAVRRARILLGDTEARQHSRIIFNSAFSAFATADEYSSNAKAFDTAKALSGLGTVLLFENEVEGADVCYQTALGIFKRINKKRYPCQGEIADALNSVGLIHMFKNDHKAHIKITKEVLRRYSRLAEKEPVKYLLNVASSLNTLYIHSFVGVRPSQFYRAYPYFEQALSIHKSFDNKKHQQENQLHWLHLLRNKATFIFHEMDKTDAINCYREINYFIKHASPSFIAENKMEIYKAMHEVGNGLLENLSVDNTLFSEIAKNVTEARRALSYEDPEQYRDYLELALTQAGLKFYDAEKWGPSCIYLEGLVEIINGKINEDPDKYHSYIVWPTLKLAVAYSSLKNYKCSVEKLIFLYQYFEKQASVNPSFMAVWMSQAVVLVEELFESGQKELANEYMAKTLLHLSTLKNPDVCEHVLSAFENFKQHSAE